MENVNGIELTEVREQLESNHERNENAEVPDNIDIQVILEENSSLLHQPSDTSDQIPNEVTKSYISSPTCCYNNL